jgi:hypothetical protein
MLASTSFVKEGCVCEKPNVVKLTWSSVKRAKGYFVQRSTSENKGFTTVATVDGGNVTSTEIVQDNGTKYYYQIVCFSNKKKKKTWSYPSDQVLMTSNYFCYPSENYQERCNRVFGQDHYYLQVKCQKCKFSETIDTALFHTMSKRRQKRLQAYCEEIGKALQR